MLYYARKTKGQTARDQLRKFFSPGIDPVTDKYDSAAPVDVETQALLRFNAQVTADMQDSREPNRVMPLCIGQADLLADDIIRLLTYEPYIPRSVLVDYLKTLLAFHLALYHLELLHLLLVAPTHPLRALWLSSWVQLGKSWIAKIKAGGKDYIGSVRAALLEGLLPSAFPIAIPVESGRIFTPVEELNPFWGLYAPTTEENSRGLLAEICVALGLHEPATAGSDISGRVIADKIERYLSQHPYIRQLSLNIFNPGSGAIVADALLALQQKREYADLRYDIRLFASDPDSPTLGEALEAIDWMNSITIHGDTPPI